MDVGRCEFYNGVAFASWSSRDGFRWDTFPERIHATRAVMALYDVRQVYRWDATCSEQPGVVHASRHPE